MTTIDELRHEANALNVCGGIAKLMRQAASELEALQKERDALKVEYESRAIWIANMLKALDCENKDGFHCVDAHFVAETLRAQNRELRDGLKIANGEEITRAHAESFRIELSKHICGCDICARSTKLCPATQSSIAQEIFSKLLSQPEAGK